MSNNPTVHAPEVRSATSSPVLFPHHVGPSQPVLSTRVTLIPPASQRTRASLLLTTVVAIGGLGLRDHEAGEPVFLCVASGLGQTGELLGHERLKLIDPERIDFLASTQQGSKSLESRADSEPPNRLSSPPLPSSYCSLPASFRAFFPLAERAVCPWRRSFPSWARRGLSVRPALLM